MTPLESLDRMWNAINDLGYLRNNGEQDYQLVKKSLQALEIIKEKEVDVFLLKDCPNLAHYNRHFDYSEYIKLTRNLNQEEWDLLKEISL